MDLRQLTRTVRELWWAVVLTFLVVTAAGAVAGYGTAANYSATATLAAQPVGADAQNGNGSSAAQWIQLVMPQMAAQAESPSFLAEARHVVPTGLAKVPVTVSALGDPGTGVLTVAVTSASASASSTFAEQLANLLISHWANNNVIQLGALSLMPPPATRADSAKAILAGAAGIGLILGVFVALLVASIRRRFSKVEEVRASVGATVLAEIPRVRRGAVGPAHVFEPGGDVFALEAFQELRNNLLLALGDGTLRSLAITSHEPGEGKTSVAAGVAWSLASYGREVLAVDCDVRRPALHTVFGVPFGRGVSNVRAGQPVPQAMPTANPSLALLPAGVPDRHPADVLGASLPVVLDLVAQEGRLAVLDCPPLNGLAETVFVAAAADAVIVVVDTRRFEPQALAQTLRRLDSAGATVMGVVLNRARIPRHRLKGPYAAYYGAAPKKQRETGGRNQKRKVNDAVAAARRAEAIRAAEQARRSSRHVPASRPHQGGPSPAASATQTIASYTDVTNAQRGANGVAHDYAEPVVPPVSVAPPEGAAADPESAPVPEAERPASS